MNKHLSQYLDLLRLVAALLVLVAHLSDPLLVRGGINIPDQLGYSAVMIFFVLSGYVISYVATEREFSLIEFSISRLARVYSVVIPALALTIAVDTLFLTIAPFYNAKEFLAGIPGYQYAHFPKYLILNLFFGNQAGGLSEPAFSNGVYWSMCFEVYYYVIFAIAFYVKGFFRILLLIICTAIIGIGPLLHFHLWLFGFAVYYWGDRWSPSLRIARLLFWLTIVFLIGDLATNLNVRIDSAFDLGASRYRRLTGDTITGLLVAFNILAARHAGLTMAGAGRLIAYFASFSFSLYLMHEPLLRMFSAYWHPGLIPILAATLVSVWSLGQVTERQKERFRHALRRVARQFQKRSVAVTAAQE